MRKKILSILIFLLFLIIAFCGCYEENKKELSVEQIISNFSNAVNNVSSYRFSSNGLTTKTVIDNSDANITEMLSFSNGTIDITNHNLKLENDYITIGKKYEQWNVYILDYFVYTGSGEKGNLSWESEHVSTSFFGNNFWKSYSVLEGLAEGLVNPQENTTFKRLDDETINGEQYYVIQSLSLNNSSSSKHSAYSFNELQMKLWINKNNNLLYKTQSTMTSDDTGIFSVWGNQSTIITNGQFIFYDYNKQITIELPPDVEKEEVIYLKGFIEEDGKVKIQNQGGSSIIKYRMMAKNIDGKIIGNETFNETENPWDISEYRYVFSDVFLLKENEYLWVGVYEIQDDGSEERIFEEYLVYKNN